MRRGHAAVGAILAVVLATSGCAGSGPAQPDHQLARDTAARLDGAIADAMAAAQVPGALVGVWSPEGDYVKAFGIADTATGAPINTDFYSRIGSVTKTFTATAVLQLAERNKVDLDHPIGDYLDGIPGGQAITVRHLATMRSGLPDYLDNADFDKALAAEPTRGFTPNELLGFAFAKPTVFPPGGRYQYSNTNYIVLGLLVEKVSGQSLTDYLAEHVLAPLGLSHTSLPTDTHFPDPHARGYTEPIEDDGPPLDASGWTASYAWAAGGMVSTLQDMRVWVPALARGDLISPALQEQRLQSPPSPALPPDVGYGIGVFEAAGWIGHNGSLPGYQTVAIYLPSRQMTVVVMVNTDVTPPEGAAPSTAVGKAITSVLTPDHLYTV